MSLGSPPPAPHCAHPRSRAAIPTARHGSAGTPGQREPAPGKVHPGKSGAEHHSPAATAPHAPRGWQRCPVRPASICPSWQDPGATEASEIFPLSCPLVVPCLDLPCPVALHLPAWYNVSPRAPHTMGLGMPGLGRSVGDTSEMTHTPQQWLLPWWWRAQSSAAFCPTSSHLLEPWHPYLSWARVFPSLSGRSLGQWRGDGAI